MNLKPNTHTLSYQLAPLDGAVFLIRGVMKLNDIYRTSYYLPRGFPKSVTASNIKHSQDMQTTLFTVRKPHRENGGSIVISLPLILPDVTPSKGLKNLLTP